MNVREIMRKILYYVSVPKCVNCKQKLDYEDRGLCKRCMRTYNEHKTRNCSRCSKKLIECSCPSEYLLAHGIKQISKVFRYSKAEQSRPSNYLIYSLKQDNREDVIEFLADEMVSSIKNSFDITKGKYLITSVPRRRNAILNFGFDHAEILAKNVSQRLNIKYERLLVSRSKNAQKSVVGAARLSNAKFDYKNKKNLNLSGYTIIIVDDIVTTGASMSSCAILLRAFRPRRIVGATLGIAYKDAK